MITDSYKTHPHVFIYAVYIIMCACALSITVTAKISIVTLYKNEMETCILPTTRS